MFRKFTTLAVFAMLALTAQAQKFKFGVHIDPTISLLGSNDKKVVRDGANFAFRFGMQGDLQLGDKENYVATFGLGFIFGEGGKLKYTDGGIPLPNSDLSREPFRASDGTTLPSSGENLKMTPGTTVKYNVNYAAISAGFKIRTEEFGQTYMRAFFHLPTIDILIPASARGNITAPTGDFADTTGVATGMYAGETTKENIYPDIVPIQIMAGVGAGIEYSPNQEGGIRLIGGIYYSSGVLDMTKKVQLYNRLDGVYQEKNPRSAFQNIGLRIGIVF